MRFTVKSVLSAVACAAVIFLCYAPVFASDALYPAEKTPPDKLTKNDRFIIVNDSAENAVSRYASGSRLAKAPVTVSDVNGGKVLTYIPDEAAVFMLEQADGDDFYLLSDEGYLTSSPEGNGLFYSGIPDEYSVFRFVDGCYLYNVNSGYESGGAVQKNNYLEYYPKSDFYSTYGRTPAQDEYFRMSFYRLTGTGGDTAAGPVYSLPLFETSDVHGYIADTSTDETEYRLAYIAGRISEKRINGAENTVLLDGGDIYQGNPVSNLLEGLSVSAVFDAMKYDAVTIGNHEFDWGIEKTVDADATMPDYVIDGKKYENKIPVTVSNLYKDGEKAGFAKDCVILEKKAVGADGDTVDVKVAVIGFASDYASSIMNSKFTGAGYSIKEDYASLEKFAYELESEGKADVTVLLTHGLASDAAESLERSTVIDLVLGGHTHQNLCGKTPSGVQYIQPASYGRSYAYAELVFRKDENGASFSKVRAAQTVSAPGAEKLYNTQDNEKTLDRRTVGLTDVFFADIKGALEAEIGYITVPARKYEYIAGSGRRATTAGNWMSSITARAAEADVGFVNSGGIRTDFDLPYGEKQRPFTASDIYAMFPFENRIYCYDLTYKEFLRVLEYSLTSAGSTLLSQMWGADCYYTGRNVNAVVINGEAVYKDGKWAEGFADKHIKIAVSEFIATSDRAEDGMSNPLTAYNGTDKLVSNFLTDADGAFDVLKGEAEKSGGLLEIDTAPHYISGVCSLPLASAPVIDRSGADEDENTVTADAPAPGKTEGKTNIPVIISVASAVVITAAAAVTVTVIIRKNRIKRGQK